MSELLAALPVDEHVSPSTTTIGVDELAPRDGVHDHELATTGIPRGALDEARTGGD